jgi:hypothetical protein
MIGALGTVVIIVTVLLTVLALLEPNAVLATTEKL